MSKVVKNAAFRKIDVDKISEENYDDDMNDDFTNTGPNIADVEAFLAKYDKIFWKSIDQKFYYNISFFKNSIHLSSIRFQKILIK